MKVKRGRALAFVLSVVMVFAMVASLTGCSGVTEKTEGKVVITIGNWPDGTKPEELARMNSLLKDYNKKYPDVIVKTDTFAYDVRTYMARASSGQLPTVYGTFFTEINKIIESGYAADITDIMKTRRYDVDMNPDLLELCSKNGKIYSIPTDFYAQGLFANVDLFTKAGLVDSNGMIIFPETYEELAETAKKN